MPSNAPLKKLAQSGDGFAMKQERPQVRILPKQLAHGPAYLGVPPYADQPLHGDAKIGIVHGLAWTSVGGELLNIEALLMPGKGKLVLTGNLGEVMHESMQAAWSLTKAHCLAQGHQVDFFAAHDLHVHVPEGATPKEGPSAGIAVATAMLSSVASLPVRERLGMTGEMTLHGYVLAIGGVKEKLLAAQRYGLTHVLVPQANQKDVEDLDNSWIAGLNIAYVSHVHDVWRLALSYEGKAVETSV